MEPILSAGKAHQICLVEDDDAVRSSARLLLETMGYVVRDYLNAEAMLADAAALDAACLLLDF
jgi:FixJ family two-component response regulator